MLVAMLVTLFGKGVNDKLSGPIRTGPIAHLKSVHFHDVLSTAVIVFLWCTVLY